MTPEHLRILKTLPKVIEAVKAFQAEADELRSLLAPKPLEVRDLQLGGDDAGPNGTAREVERLRDALLKPADSDAISIIYDDARALLDRVAGMLRVPHPSASPSPAPPVLTTLRAVPDPEAEETRKAAEAELARRQAERTPEQIEADKFIESQAGMRKSLLAAILPGGTP